MEKLEKEKESQGQILFDKIDILNKTIKNQEDDLGSRQDVIRRLEERLIMLGQEKEGHLKKLNEQNTRIEEQDSQIVNLIENLEKTNVHLAQSKTERDKLQSECEAKRKELEFSFNSQIMQLSNEKDQVISKLEAEIGSTKQKLRNLNELLVTKEEEQKSIEKIVIEKETQMKMFKSTIQEKEKLSILLVASKEELQAKLKLKEEEIQLLNEEKERVHIENDQKLEEIRLINERMGFLQNEHNQKLEELRVSNEKLHYLQIDHNKMHEHLVSETSKAEALQQNLHCLTERLESIQKESQILNENLKIAKRETLDTERLKYELKCLTEKLDSLQTENQMLNEMIKTTKKNNISKFSPIREIKINDCDSFDRYLKGSQETEEMTKLVSIIVEKMMGKMGELEGKVREKAEEMEKRKGRVGEMARVVGVKLGLMEKNLKKTVGRNYICSSFIYVI